MGEVLIYFSLQCVCPGEGHSEITLLVGSLRENNEINNQDRKKLHNKEVVRILKRAN